LEENGKEWRFYNEDSMSMFAMYLKDLQSKASLDKMFDMKQF